VSQRKAVDDRFGSSPAGLPANPKRSAPEPDLAPLVLDLDAALPEGLAWELGLFAVRRRPSSLPSILVRALRGRWTGQTASREIAADDAGRIRLDPVWWAAALQARAEGRPVILLTAEHAELAERLRRAHPFMSDIVVVPGCDAVAGLARTAAVRARCRTGFVVLDASRASGPWARAGVPYRPLEPLPAVSSGPASRAGVWIRALRLHQWAKNLLVFVPLVLAGQALDPSSWGQAMLAFVAFGLAASSTYLLNDLHDLGPDRAHPSKRHRPLASGRLTIPHALAASGLGLIACGGLALAAGPAGLATIAAYLALSLAYTFAIKRQMVVDVVTLAMLFSLRLVGGIAFCGVASSAWLLAFSMFVFTSLAFGKRFIEIEQMARAGLTEVAGRGYRSQDAPVVLALGAAASAGAVLILSLFIVEASARTTFYVHPELLWAAPVALFVWLGRIWMLCGRGELRDDPVEFALTDRASYGLGLVVVASFTLACLAI